MLGYIVFTKDFYLIHFVESLTDPHLDHVTPLD